MKKKSVSLIIGLMSIALLGVMAMQVYFLNESYRLKAELFDQSVNESLSNVVSRLQKHEAMGFIKDRLKSDQAPPKAVLTAHNIKANASDKKKPVTKPGDLKERAKDIYIGLLANEQRKADSIFDLRVLNFKKRYFNVRQLSQTALQETEPDKLQIDVQSINDHFGNLISEHLSGTVIPGNVINSRRIPTRLGDLTISGRTDTLKRFFAIDSFGRPITFVIPKPVIETLSANSDQVISKLIDPKITRVSAKAGKQLADSMSIDQKTLVFNDIARQWQSSEIPIKQRLKPVDSLLRQELLNHGIRIPYKTMIDSSVRMTSLFTRTGNNTSNLPGNAYRTALFPNDFMKVSGATLTLIFPEKDDVLLAKMGAMMGASGALSLVLIACFGYTLYSILRQKKISQMKTDFINNMTHEFKTPVSTIMIASEGLKDPDVSADRSRVSRLAGIIYDENVRLANHIERVLNIAKIDGEDLKLEHKPVEMNELISAVTDSMALQLQKRNATLVLQLGALNPTVSGDELHLSNVIYNLVDNAIKYSPEDPRIEISTLNSGRQLIIRIADKGIGMSRDQQSRIFEQFYRISTGNRHDVKGFGLGLSYVNNIVKRLNGSVNVKSEKDKGSEFELIFPLI